MNNKRLESLDVVRGLDMFFLTTLGPILSRILRAGGMAPDSEALRQLSHPSWTGFTVWDMIMPFFMFCAGAAIPFAMAKYRDNQMDRSKIYWRIARRTITLWLLGMVCQGRLLSLDPALWVWFSNTLQSIAVGYLVSALMFMHTRPRTQIILASALLFIYWALMMFVKVDGFGGGDFSPEHNLCEWVDRTVLGLHCDHAKLDADTGEIVFREKYNYTWVMSSLNFIVTVMSGMFAGELMKSKLNDNKKALTMAGLGAALAAAGWLWNLQMPAIKHIWTSSMTLVSSGYSFMTMALFYYLIDIRHTKGMGWLKVYGMNSIAVYMLVEYFDLRPVCRQIFYGLEQYTGELWYKVIIECALGALIYGILRFMYKHKIFLKV